MSDNQDNNQNRDQLKQMYTRFQDSDDDDGDLLGQIKPKASKGDDRMLFKDQEVGEFMPPPVESQIIDNSKMFDEFLMPNNDINIPDQVKVKKQNTKKQIPLEVALDQIQQKLSQKSSIQNKISGLKLLSQKINENKSNNFKSQQICTWLQAMKIVENLVHEDSHPQILRNILTVLRFLYENHKIGSQWIKILVLSGIKSNEQYLKVVQAVISWLNPDDLINVFNFIVKQCSDNDLENHNVVAIMLTIVSNRTFVEENLVQSQKKKPVQQDNLLGDYLQNLQHYEPPLFFDQPQINKQNEESIKRKQAIRTLTFLLFNFLIEATESHMNIYYPIFNKLISSKHAFLSNQLAAALPELIKNGKINAIWILQHCLKIDFGQANGKQKGTKNQAKLNFVSKLVNQHLYEYLLIILARVRFNKVVVDKILNIFILLSKNYKPLDDVYTQYIWKILGLNSRQQKEREQFFNFVKDILRNESNFTQQSVYFIFFEVLMSLKAQWFSLKILDCLQMLFMRLNQDLKLISYVSQTYEIQDPDLVGIDKFWYIYFCSVDPKVTKKCKDFLWKLTTYIVNPDVKIKLLKEYINKITNFMSECPEDNKIDFCQKGFQIIDKLMQEGQKKQNATQTVQLVIKNECRDAIAPKNIDLKLSQKCRLEHLREQISLAINPPSSSIRLLVRGQFLKGQKMTLKDLSITNGITIMVTDDEPKQKSNQQKDENLKNITFQLTQLFGSEIKQSLLKFIAQKMQGQEIDRIVEAIMSQQKLASMTAQFEEQSQKDKKQQLKVIDGEGKIVHFTDENKNQQMKQALNNAQIVQPMADAIVQQEMKNEKDQNEINQNKDQSEAKFSSVLVSNSQYINQLLSCGSSSKIRSWQTIKKLPHSSYFIDELITKCEQKNWEFMFPKVDLNELKSAYYAHVLTSILRANVSKLKTYMLEFGGFEYLSNWLKRLPIESSCIIIEQVTNLLVLTLQLHCSVLANFKKRVNSKPDEQVRLLGVLMDQNGALMTPENIQQQIVVHCDSQLLSWLINFLLKLQNEVTSSCAIFNTAEIIVFLVLNSDQRIESLLGLPLVEISYIIQSHGFVGEYIFLSAISRILIKGPQVSAKYCDKFLDLADLGFDFQNETSPKETVIYLYDIVTCILDKTKEHPAKQAQITVSAIKAIRTFLQQMSAQQLVSLFSLLKLSIFKLYREQVDSNLKQQLEGPIAEFAQWLFSNYLFELEKMSKHTRNKAIRKVCYELLAIISEENLLEAHKLIDKIMLIELKQRNKDEDYIDFRSQDYIGLTNLGATCYINSLLQQLYHTKFSTLLLQQGDIDPTQSQRVMYLKQIFMRLCYSIKNVVNPKQFIKNMSFYGEAINTSVQQDAMEFLLCLFDFIQGERCQAQVYEVFGGYLNNQITVEDEQPLVKENKEHFNSLTIDILGKKNLQQALAYFIKPQTLDGQNKYYCQELGKKMKASKRCYIQKMPNILILTLKRFQFDYDSHSRHKLNDYFEFPLELDMHKYSAAYLRDKEESSQSKYKLSGILVHSGSAQSGHYYSYVKIGEQWYEFNDKHVTEFNIHNNLKNQCFGCSEGKKTRSAYMLFYEKWQTNYHGVYLDQIPQTNSYKEKILQENEIFLKSRLIYDQNFKKFLIKLQQLTDSEDLRRFIDNIEGSKNNKMIAIDNKGNNNNQNQMVYFDADENQPLIGNNGGGTQNQIDQFFRD